MRQKKIALSLLVISIFFNVDAYHIRAAFQNNAPKASTEKAEATMRARALTPVVPGRDMTLAFELVSDGKVNAVSFTINFDPTVFKYVSSALGADKPEAAHLAVNAEQTAKGKFGLLVDAIKPFEKGTRQVVTAVFRVADDARPGSHSFTFSPTPTQQGTAATDGRMLKTDYQTAVINIGERKSAIVGRVLDMDWRGLRHAKVVLKKPDGTEKVYLTGTFGTFLFEDLAEGSYTIVVNSRNYSFTPQVVEAKGPFTELRFIEAT